MIERLFRRWSVCSVAGSACVLMVTASAHAVTLDGLQGSGFEHIYGSYAPGGDCARDSRVTIGDAGMTFRATGRTVTAERIEYAASFFGGAYEGDALAFFPFPRGDMDFGHVLMFVNEERTGTVRIEAEAEPGQRLDPFHAAIIGSYQLCPGTGSGVAPPPVAEAVPVPGTPLEWTNLPRMEGRYPGSNAENNIDIFHKGAIAAALRKALGEKMSVLEINLSTVTPLRRQGDLHYIMGNAPHRGGEDQAYVLIDAAKRAVQVGLWEQGRLTVYAPAGGRLRVPLEVREMLARSPGETAIAAPGMPWEILPVQGRSPVAYVEAAASPNITSITLYCENGRPYMAMLLNKPRSGTRSTMTWNFAGRLVDIPVQRADDGGAYWVGDITRTPLIEHLTTHKDVAHLRIDGRLEGDASLVSAAEVLRATLRECVRL
jgi:hypothetical protein